MDDLGKRITQVTGFTWELGMAVAGKDGTFVVNRAPYGYHGGGCEDDAELQLETDEWIFAKNAELDIDHPANTGFLLQMCRDAWDTSFDVDYPSGHNGVEHVVSVYVTYSRVREFYGEHINHALARAIIAASGVQGDI